MRWPVSFCAYDLVLLDSLYEGKKEVLIKDLYDIEDRLKEAAANPEKNPAGVRFTFLFGEKYIKDLAENPNYEFKLVDDEKFIVDKWELATYKTRREEELNQSESKLIDDVMSKYVLDKKQKSTQGGKTL